MLPRRDRHDSVDLVHPQRAELVQPAGQRRGERRRDVLGDHHRRAQGRRQLRQQLGEQLRAAGGRADQHQVDRDLPRRGCPATVAGGCRPPRPGPLAARPAARPSRARGRGTDLLHQLGGDLLDVERDGAARLGHVVDRAQLQRLQGDQRIPLGQRGDHDDRRGLPLHDLGQAGEPVHLRHVHVQRDHVGVDPGQLFERVHPVAGGVHLELAGLGQDFLERPAHQRRVVDDQDRGGRLSFALVRRRRGRRRATTSSSAWACSAASS